MSTPQAPFFVYFIPHPCNRRAEPEYLKLKDQKPAEVKTQTPHQLRTKTTPYSLCFALNFLDSHRSFFAAMKKDSSPQSASGAGKPQTRSVGTNTSPCQPKPRPAGRYTSGTALSPLPRSHDMEVGINKTAPALVTASNIIIVLLVLSTFRPHTSLDRLCASPSPYFPPKPPKC